MGHRDQIIPAHVAEHIALAYTVKNPERFREWLDLRGPRAHEGLKELSSRVFNSGKSQDVFDTLLKGLSTDSVVRTMLTTLQDFEQKHSVTPFVDIVLNPPTHGVLVHDEQFFGNGEMIKRQAALSFALERREDIPQFLDEVPSTQSEILRHPSAFLSAATTALTRIESLYKLPKITTDNAWIYTFKHEKDVRTVISLSIDSAREKYQEVYKEEPPTIEDIRNINPQKDFEILIRDRYNGDIIKYLEENEREILGASKKIIELIESVSNGRTLITSDGYNVFVTNELSFKDQIQSQTDIIDIARNETKESKTNFHRDFIKEKPIKLHDVAVSLLSIKFNNNINPWSLVRSVEKGMYLALCSDRESEIVKKSNITSNREEKNKQR